MKRNGEKNSAQTRQCGQYSRKTARLKNPLNSIESWMNKWRTKLSTNKTVWTIFSKDCKIKTSLKLNYAGKEIKMDRNPKFLGVTLDPGLCFNKYAETIKERTSRRLNMLKRIKGRNWGASSHLIMISYKTLIRPIIDYIPFITPLMAKSNYLILERIQRRAARSITFWPIKTRTTDIYEQINLEDVLSRAWTLTDKYMSKAIRNNDLIRSMLETYNIAPELNEGIWCKYKSGLRKTIIGRLIEQPNLNCHNLLRPNPNIVQPNQPP